MMTITICSEHSHELSRFMRI